MLCVNCGSKGLVRGIKKAKCSICQIECYVNVTHTDICIDCSNQYGVCQCCGEQIKFAKQEEYVLLKWGE